MENHIFFDYLSAAGVILVAYIHYGEFLIFLDQNDRQEIPRPLAAMPAAHSALTALREIVRIILPFPKTPKSWKA